MSGLKKLRLVKWFKNYTEKRVIVRCDCHPACQNKRMSPNVVNIIFVKGKSAYLFNNLGWDDLPVLIKHLKKDKKATFLRIDSQSGFYQEVFLTKKLKKLFLDELQKLGKAHGVTFIKNDNGYHFQNVESAERRLSELKDSHYSYPLF